MFDMYRSVGWYTFDTVIRIQVFVESELEKSRSSLPNNSEFVSNHLWDTVKWKSKHEPRGYNAISQKEHPNPVPPLAILLNNLVLI
jgi:hypothetical protein